MKKLIHIAIVFFLTIITQVGGVVWILTFGIIKFLKVDKSRSFRLGIFLIAYLVTTLLFVPLIAGLSGRVALPLTQSGNLVPHNIMTPLLNRHYVKPQLKDQLSEIADQMHQLNPDLKVSYLDANFPFIDGYPLLPHLSHNDGRKVDLTFYYTEEGKEGNSKPSWTGYGAFVDPNTNEFDQTKHCKSSGHWQYDYTKFMTLGSSTHLEFDQVTTKKLVNLIVDNGRTQKVFIEPHLKERMSITNSKVRFQGCHAVRHDDHIHYQINK